MAMSRRSVTLVTGDVNMQNKADVIGLAYVDPDEPADLVAPPTPSSASLVYASTGGIVYDGRAVNKGDRFLALPGEVANIDALLHAGLVQPA